MYKEKIKSLEVAHRALDKEIADMERNHPHVEVDKLAELKKRKLQLKDEISRLTKLQWIEDHERVHGMDE
jgi:hypothetical protein